MPYVIVQWLEGRTAEQKQKICTDITESLIRHTGARPQDCAVVFQDTSADDWFVEGESMTQRRAKAKK